MIQFSSSAEKMRSSEIRQLMQLAADPKIISFAGGMPNADLLPTQTLDSLWQSLPENTRRVAMQYGPTSGIPTLLESLGAYLKAKGILTNENGLIITTGAQQALNLVAKVLLNPHDAVITENPSFIGALAAFLSYEA